MAVLLFSNNPRARDARLGIKEVRNMIWIKREKAANGLTEVTLLYNTKQIAMHCFLNKNGRMRGKVEIYRTDGDFEWSFELNDNEEINGTLIEPDYDGTDSHTCTSEWKDGVLIDPGDDGYEVGSTVDDLERIIDGDPYSFIDSYVLPMDEWLEEHEDQTEEVDDQDLEGFEEYDGNLL